MLRARIIPTLLLRHQSLVKTTQFGKFTYIGDPCNTVRIFNELEVDELAFLDITATRHGRGPDLKVLREVANECFMSLSYGGGVTTLDEATQILSTGFEKVIVNSHAVASPTFITELADKFGRQAVVVSIDVKRNWRGVGTVRTCSGTEDTGLDPVEWAMEAERRGAGEILLTSIDREGTWSGYDIDLVRRVSAAIRVPLIANGGAGSVKDIADVVQRGGASAAGVGSMVLFQKKGMGVLVHFPDMQSLAAVRDAERGAPRS